MEEFALWFLGYEYILYLPDVHVLFSYLALALMVFGLKMVFVLKFLHFKFIEEKEARERLHGPAVGHSSGKQVLAVSAGPVIEEVGFRGPVLWFALQGQHLTALWVCFASAVVFSLMHLTSREKYEDGSKFFITRTALIQIGAGGVLYGIITIISGSLWPAVFSHIMWNGYVLFVYPRLDQVKIANAAQYMQRT